MTKSYWDHVQTGDLTPGLALKMTGERNVAKSNALATIGAHGKAGGGDAAEATAFGMLDGVSVALVKFYGGPAAAEVLRHYAEICGRRPAKGEAAASEAAAS